MAKKDQYLVNSRTGQSFLFLTTAKDSGGDILEIESSYPPFSEEPPVHYHPAQEECFTIVSGDLTVRIHGEIKVYSPGDVLRIKPGVPHSMWNAGWSKTVVSWQVYPAMETEYFLETMVDLANHGKTDEKGVPGLITMLHLLKTYKHVFRLFRPHFMILQILFVLLAPVFFLRKGRKF